MSHLDYCTEIAVWLLTNEHIPIAPYFANCLSAQDLDELNIEIIRNTLYKSYLEDFYDFCQKLGGPTAEIMGDILEVIFASHGISFNQRDGF